MSKKTPAKTSEKSAAPKKAPRVAKSTVKLPVLVEAMYTIPPLVILGVDLIVIGFSYTSGADWVSILVRACVTTLALGSLMLLVASIVSSGALASAMEMRKKTAEQAKLDDSRSIEA